MAGDNLLWHTRYDAAGKRFLVRECRTCSNVRYRAKRNAAKRNHELDLQAAAATAGTVDQHVAA
jgi:hypothetical protein